MSVTNAAFDTHMMAIALVMARRGLGLTAPNPSVGAVIADEAAGEVIARGVTAPGGRPHAETIAIATAGQRAQGKTIYVTLEPCSHHGKTGPCAEAIINAGLKRVVVGIEDPDPRVAGRGLDMLRKAGIDVKRGVMASEARWVTRGHIVRVTERRPFVTLKLALDARGEVPRGGNGQPNFVTSPEARAHGHLLRAKADAILAGSGTVRDDDPELTCRLPGLTKRSPLRVVLTHDLGIPIGSKLVQSARDVALLLVCGFDAKEERAQALCDRGVEVARVPVVAGRLWLPAVMEELIARGITRLLVEGGPAIWRGFADAALADAVALYMPGGNETRARAAVLERLGTLPLTMTGQRTLGPDTLWHFRSLAPDLKL